MVRHDPTRHVRSQSIKRTRVATHVVSTVLFPHSGEYETAYVTPDGSVKVTGATFDRSLALQQHQHTVRVLREKLRPYDPDIIEHAPFRTEHFPPRRYPSTWTGSKKRTR